MLVLLQGYWMRRLKLMLNHFHSDIQGLTKLPYLSNMLHVCKNHLIPPTVYNAFSFNGNNGSPYWYPSKGSCMSQ